MPFQEFTGQLDAPSMAPKWQEFNGTLDDLTPKAAPKPEAPKPEPGLMGELERGGHEIYSNLRTALTAPFVGSDVAARAGAEREEEYNKTAAPSVDVLGDIQKAYQEKGILSSIGAGLKDLPALVGQVAPTVAEYGAAEALLPVVGPAALFLAQHYGQNVAQTAATQMAQGRDVDVDSLKALGYAVPQAALDVAHISIPLGKQVIGKIFGRGVEEAVEKGAMSEAEKLAQEQLAKKSFGESIQDGLKTGLVSGVPIMVAQTALERAYNGDKLFNDDALHQYGSAALSGALMAPMGVLGALSEKSQAAKAVGERDAAAAKAAADAAEAEANLPENLLKLHEDFQNAKAEQADLRNQIPSKPKKDAPEEEVQAYNDAKTAADQHLNDVLKPLKLEFDQRKDAIMPVVLADQTAKINAAAQAQSAMETAIPQETAAAPINNAPPITRATLPGRDMAAQLTGNVGFNQNLLQAGREGAEQRDVATQNAMRVAADKRANQILSTTFSNDPAMNIMKQTSALKQMGYEAVPDKKGNLVAKPIAEPAPVEAPAPAAPLQANPETMRANLEAPAGQANAAFMQAAREAREATAQRDAAAQKAQEQAKQTQANQVLSTTFSPDPTINTLRQNAALKQLGYESVLDKNGKQVARPVVTLPPELAPEPTPAPAPSPVGNADALRARLATAGNEANQNMLQAARDRLAALEKQKAADTTAQAQNIVKSTMSADPAIDIARKKSALAEIGHELAQDPKTGEITAQPIKEAAPEMSDVRKNVLSRQYDEEFKSLFPDHEPEHLEQFRSMPAESKDAFLQLFSEAGERKFLENPEFNDLVEKGKPEQFKARSGLTAEAEPPELVDARNRVTEAEKDLAESKKTSNYVSMRKLLLDDGKGNLHPQDAIETDRKDLAAPKGPRLPATLAARIGNGDFDEYLSPALRIGEDKSADPDANLSKVLEAEEAIKQKIRDGDYRTWDAAFNQEKMEQQLAYAQSQLKPLEESHQQAQAANKAVAELPPPQTTPEGLPVRTDNLYRVQGEAKGVPVNLVQRLVNQIREGWANAPEIQVHADESTLPDHIRAQAERDKVTGQIPGVYDPNSKIVHIVSSNLADVKDLFATVAHEAAGHFGLREMLGDQYGRTMDKIYEGNKAVREAADEKMKGSNLSRQVATEEVLAEMAESEKTSTPAERSALKQIYDTIRRWVYDKFGIGGMTDNDVKQIVANARKFVVEGGEKGAGNITSEAVYRTKYNPGFEKAADLTKKVLSSERPFMEQFNKTAFGRASLGWIQKVQDQYRPFLKLTQLKDANGQRLISDSAGNQMMSDLRFYQQRLNFLGAVIQNGALTFKKGVVDGAKRSLYETDGKESLKQVFTELRPADKITGSREATNALYSLWAIAERVRKGGATLEQLNFDPSIVNAKSLKAAMDEIKQHPELIKTFEKANETYQNFNANMMKFAVDAGAIPKATADKLLARRDYVPYYREEPDGTISMMSNGESIFKVGNIKTQPELKSLIGGDQRILDFSESSVRNANMLLSMGMRNQAVKNSMFELQKIGLVDIRDKAPKNMEKAVEFKVQGKSKYAVFDDAATEKLNIPTQLFIKGLEGVPTQMSTWLKVMSIPSTVLKEMFVANPISAARIVFKDTMSSALVAGSDFGKIVDSLQSVKDGLMVKRGLSGGQLFTGQPEEIARVLRQAQAGGVNASSALAMAHALHAQADATTRQIRYDSYLHQGLNEFDANLMALESMNFTKRGLSPSIHILNALNPFINSQIQGVNTLIAAIRGDMPMQEQLRIKQKILARGAMIAGATMLYSALMQDNKHYRDAMPDQKYSNWYMPFPGLEEPVKIPIPFEAGMLFKSVPEAMVELFMKHDKSAIDGLKMTAMRMIPGLETSAVAQAVRPGLEAYTNTSLQTGETIQSERELKMLPGERIRPGTSGVAQEIGGALNLSPIMIDHVIGGYTSSMGMALMHITDGIVGSKMQGAPVASDLSQTPVIGSLFARDGGAILQEAMGKFHDLEEVKNTFTSLKNAGQTDRAMAFLRQHQEEYAKAAIATSAQKQIGQFTKQIEMVVANKDMTGEEKKRRIDQIKEQRRDFAEKMLARVS
jgi:hypothetical protein